MNFKTERFEMRLEPKMLDQLDAWRIRYGDGVSRSEAARRLMETGLRQIDERSIRISDGERLITIMLCDLYRRMDVKDGVFDPDFIKSILSGGHYWALAWEHSGFFDRNHDREQIVAEVTEILDMWRFLEHGYKQLSDSEKKQVVDELNLFDGKVHFSGFDSTNESEHYAITQFLLDKMNRYGGFKDRKRDAHSDRLDGYRRMLKVFSPMRPMLAGSDLSAVQIIKILEMQKLR